MFHKFYIKSEAFEENLLKMKEVRSNNFISRCSKLKFHKIPKIREIFILSKEESKRDYRRFVKIKLMQRKNTSRELDGFMSSRLPLAFCTELPSLILAEEK